MAPMASISSLPWVLTSSNLSSHAVAVSPVNDEERALSRDFRAEMSPLS